MEKKDPLQAALGQLSAQQAATLARNIELQRALGQESLPTELVLDGVRPLLSGAQAIRAPTICRLICNGFEEFLTDRQGEPRVEGLIPRKSIGPWWAAIWHLARNEIAALTVRLRSMLAMDPKAPLQAFEREVQHAAAGWAAAIVAGLEQEKPDIELKKLLRGPLADDARSIAQILPMAQPIAEAIKGLTLLLERLHLMDGARIVDLAPEAVALLKQYYGSLSESHGTEARYLALAVMNRLARPCHILRLARALSWKPTDFLLANTEFGCIGSRLVGELQHTSQSIATLVAPHRTLPPPEELSRQLSRYLDEAESLVNEFGFRREAPWGEAILRTRTELAATLDGALMQRLAERVLEAVPDADATAAADRSTTTATALQSARFIRLVAQRGERHGFARAAREAHAALGAELELRVDVALKQLRRDPRRVSVLAQRLEAVAVLFDAIGEEGRGRLLLRQIGEAGRASA